jgi:hypothetical protein
MIRRIFIRTMIGTASLAGLPLPTFVLGRPVRRSVQLTLSDLVRMHDQGLTISREDFRSVFDYENTHRDFSSCHRCGVQTFGQHEIHCPRATVLVLPGWYEEIQRRVA